MATHENYPDAAMWIHNTKDNNDVCEAGRSGQADKPFDHQPSTCNIQPSTFNLQP
jgi:hypothetical protein